MRVIIFVTLLFCASAFVFPFQNHAVAIGRSRWSQDMGVDISTVGAACGNNAVIVSCTDGVVVRTGAQVKLAM
jgi:hypothetical protein